MELLALWQEIIPETVQHDSSSWTSTRAGNRNLAARWKAGFKMKNSKGELLSTDRQSGLEWWGKFFQWLRKSDFLMNNFKGFSLEWIVKAANFNKAKEGNYHA